MTIRVNQVEQGGLGEGSELRAGAFRLDETDRGIIEALQSDGRRPYSEIAREIGVSDGAVRYRAERLREEGVLQVVGVADPLRIGFDLFSLVGLRVRSGTARAVCTELSQLPETSYVVMIAGDYDVLAEVVCRDTNHFTELLTSRVQTIDGVNETRSFLVLEVYKMAYGWGVAGLRASTEGTEPEGIGKRSGKRT